MRSEALNAMGLNAKARGRKDAKVVGEISPASLRLGGFALVLKQVFKFAEKYPRLVAEVDECLAEGERLAALVRSALQGVTNV